MPRIPPDRTGQRWSRAPKPTKDPEEQFTVEDLRTALACTGADAWVTGAASALAAVAFWGADARAIHEAATTLGITLAKCRRAGMGAGTVDKLAACGVPEGE
jgi:hypothetical protein